MGHISFVSAHELLHSDSLKYMNGNALHVVDTTSTSGLVRARIDFCEWMRIFLESCFSWHKMYLMSVPVV